ncbi:nucleotidyl transferase AbiEii/AbiGii toxin family protein [Chitinophaga ginsengisoli]|uniref:Nucleotidyltransferase AbiEii toxin of type IV toxin-antitoxin system n=1 Tax=Chitinophaga ginsengisoli TaxID=363837 RepID=A0A2P8GDJ0_9BACT|nr:nucleotidyl transferase AbiEii/AbiGii toxin family protein [Chitinophaga ginsengisoli]PSL32006.1 nucleotidyltransferase AbiEii toxin of type IV toxin-antitoxin system [Chitinophaga ginsengisoli]
MLDDQFEQALSQELVDAIVELQSLPSLSAFALAGGASLALRFNHRRSIDIDLFSNQAVGKAGLETIISELKTFYGNDLMHLEIIDPEAGDQFYFLRAFIRKSKELIIKVEVIQNIAILDPFEQYNGIRTLSLRDIGLLKLVSASNRKAKKDIYDLDFITEQIELSGLMVMLEEKQNKYKEDTFKSLFDLDREHSPVEDINLLLAFDEVDYTALPRRPNHSHDLIDILPASKNWRLARSSWRRKVINLMRMRGMQPPPIKPVN